MNMALAGNMHPVALAVFCVAFALVTVAGFLAAKWRRPDEGLHSLEEWGLGGRSFGTLITWFLLGGDVYTAYTVIAVPAALYGAGALGFFAVPYTILIYPYMMLVLPKLWTVCHRNGYVTFADFVKGRFEFRPLTVAIALTGILSLMPYIALQLVGMKVALAAMGLRGEWPLILAFLILAFYTYSAGLRAPAIIAVVKDIMLYVMVIAAVIWLPSKLGGFGHIFAVAAAELPKHSPPGGTLLKAGQYLPYSTLAIGSALALILYPHTSTATLSSSGPQTLRRNAALLPAYTLMLGLLALLGYVALAAGVKAADKSEVIPLLFLNGFPEWFAGFCLAAVAIGALVPAAIMSIAAANLFTRNLWGEFVKTPLTAQKEAAQAKIVSLIVKFGALAFVLETPGSYAIEMQLLGGIWITQLFPAVVCGAFVKRRALHPWAVFAGWLAGMVWGSGMAIALEFKGSGVYPLHVFGQTWSMYAAIPALVLNLVISFGLSPVFAKVRPIALTA
ncbi:monocarboxylate uptake permease MctP [Terriglobus sp. ADX1]|uniref:monocarboxylate uptake permease MctP n=1 Tax=Terriglobus sp. ADX1 TaxID=2794063 RepID=UPI002FE4FE1C